MPKTLNTVKSVHGVRCPRCERDERLLVAIDAWALLTPDGSLEQGDHEWSDLSAITCDDCGWQGEVAEARVPKVERMIATVPAPKECKCENCAWHGPETDVLPDIPHFHQRVFPGEICPVGECPDCRALCHYVDEDDRKTGPRTSNLGGTP
jgi:hypothetical protein